MIQRIYLTELIQSISDEALACEREPNIVERNCRKLTLTSGHCSATMHQHNHLTVKRQRAYQVFSARRIQDP